MFPERQCSSLYSQKLQGQLGEMENTSKLEYIKNISATRSCMLGKDWNAVCIKKTALAVKGKSNLIP